MLVDSSHVTHAAQTVELVRHALGDLPLACVVNTHLHSDHCGGNAALREAFGAQLLVPPGLADPVRRWDPQRLNYDDIGQLCARFEPAGELVPGASLHAGGCVWEVLAAPGHDPDSVMLLERTQGVLISADALWEDGFGVVFPELEGSSGFNEAAAVFDLIESLPVRVVVPGHGAPFTDVDGALARARKRLAGQRADPARHARHAVKVLVKYHLMERRRETREEFDTWACGTPFLARVWEHHGRDFAASPGAWAWAMLAELENAGLARVQPQGVEDRG